MQMPPINPDSMAGTTPGNCDQHRAERMTSETVQFGLTLHTLESHTVIVGAGPAGLAVGACLQRAGRPALILEQSGEVGSSWRRHYDRLHLHTDKAHSALPLLRFPEAAPRYPSRLQVIQYLEDYARQMGLQPRFGQQVIGVSRTGDAWHIRTPDAVYAAQHVVIATGYNRAPHWPEWPGQSTFRGPILHSSQYRNGTPFRNQKVLVVGFGNSGGEIAIDLCESGAQPSLAVRSPVNIIPRELFGIPVLTIAMLQRRLPPGLADALNAPLLAVTFGDLRGYGLCPSRHGPLAQIQERSRIPLIDIGTIKLIKNGRIAVRPGIERFSQHGVHFTDGTTGEFDTVILATGYRPQLNAFLENATAVLDENGVPRVRGYPGPIRGLYFCGYNVSATGMLREIGLEAQRISAAVADKS